VRVSARAAQRVREGYPWVWRTELVRDQPLPEAGADVLTVQDDRGRGVATALWCARSPIALRVVQRTADPANLGAGATETPPSWPAAELSARLARAIADRRRLFPGEDGVRLVHAEADGLAGLFVDQYGDALTVQIVTAGMDRREARVVELLRDQLAPRLIVLRNDGSARDFEELPRHRRVALGELSQCVARYHEGSIVYEVDLLDDAKTGAFVDQRENHLRVAGYASGVHRALDLFTCHGGFALQLARAGVAHVTAVDQRPAAVERVRSNAKANGLDGQVVAQQADAFDLLRRLDGADERFDLVVLDPPALAKQARGGGATHARARRGSGEGGALADELRGATRAYRELNLRAMRLVRPGGILVTASCSGRMTPELFGRALVEAAAGAGRQIQLLERTGAGRDHPVLLGVPETEYLTCWFLRVI
jgi:23S rRNA (cytosine1962-C5)-methyltransferase